LNFSSTPVKFSFFVDDREKLRSFSFLNKIKLTKENERPDQDLNLGILAETGLSQWLAILR
jgi:hypothetical protein